MVGIDPNGTSHALKIDPKIKLEMQRRQHERQEVRGIEE